MVCPRGGGVSSLWGGLLGMVEDPSGLPVTVEASFHIQHGRLRGSMIP